MDTLELLCQCITPINNKELLLSEVSTPGFNWEPVVYCSGQHLVSPALWFYLKQKNILPMLNQELQDYLELTFELNLTRNQAIKEQLFLLLPDFNQAGIEPLLLKGIASLIGGLYDSTGIRVLGDIDILIPQDKLKTAKNIMIEHGYRYTPFPHQDIVTEHRHLPAFLHTNHPVSIEIHRFPVATKHNGWVNNQSAWSGSKQISTKAGVISLPSPEYRLLHNFCHCQLGDRGYVRGYINARQMLEWVTLRNKYGTEIDWISMQKRAELNGSTAAWDGYLLAAEEYFSQKMTAHTKLSLLTHFFMFRQRLGIRYSWFWHLNLVQDKIFAYMQDIKTILFLNIKRGPDSFIKALWFISKRLLFHIWSKTMGKSL